MNNKNFDIFVRGLSFNRFSINKCKYFLLKILSHGKIVLIKKENI